MGTTPSRRSHDDMLWYFAFMHGRIHRESRERVLGGGPTAAALKLRTEERAQRRALTKAAAGGGRVLREQPGGLPTAAAGESAEQRQEGPAE